LEEDESGAVCEASPARPEDLDWIFRLQIDTYSVRHAVARKKLDEWYGSNPDGFSIVKINGRRIGHLTIVPLRPNILESFVDGTVLEQNIHGENLFTPHEKDLIRNLYVESIIIDSPKGPSTLPIAAFARLASDFIPLIARICDPSQLENIYALAASGKGERFMKGLGLVPVQSVRERADQRTLYVAEFETVKTRISELLERRLRNQANQAVRTA
jgi:hypothetical protein